VRPDIIGGNITLAPRLPADFGAVDFSVRIGEGSIRGVYEQHGELTRYDWVAEGVGFEARVDIPGFAVQSVPLQAGQRLSVTEREAMTLEIMVYDAEGTASIRSSAGPDARRREHEAMLEQIFDGVHFAAPRDPALHPVMR
jgi:hypothetical protein